MKIKTAELLGKPLDWAVREALLHTLPQPELGMLIHQIGYGNPADPYSTNPLYAWPIIERELISTKPWCSGWMATKHLKSNPYGPTLLIAAMRCYVASQLGNEVEVPDELIMEKYYEKH